MKSPTAASFISINNTLLRGIFVKHNLFERLESRRLLSAGVVDSSFGTNGNVTGHVSFPADVGLTLPNAGDMVLQADGKSVIAGQVNTDATHHQLLVARFNVDGSLDTTYGTNGFTVVNFGGSNSVGTAIALDSSGRAVVAGYSVNTAGTKTSFAVARLTTAGKLDTSFSSDGMTVTDFAQKTAEVNDVAIAPDGRIVAAGFSSDGPGTSRFAVARYTTSGQLDTGFSVDGLQTVDADSGNDAANVVTVLSNGRIVMGGYLTHAGGQSDFAIVRLTTSGQLDKTFDANGIAAVDFGGE